jgi:hypothetical protein
LDKNKNMEGVKEEQKEVCGCPACAKRLAEHAENELMNLAILLALMPALTITFLSNAGFF